MDKIVTQIDGHEMNRDGTALYGVSQFSYRQFVEFWPKLEKLLDAVPHTWKYWNKEYIYRSVVSGGIQIWGAGPPPNAVLILMTTINTYPEMKVFNVVWAAGNMPDGVLDVVDETFVQFARMQECEYIEIRGRRGWHPFMKAHGYKREAEVWTKKIPEMRIN